MLSGDRSITQWVGLVVLGVALAWDASAVLRLARGTDVQPRVMPPLLPAASIARRPLDDPSLFSLAAARSPFGDDAGRAAPGVVQAAVPVASVLPRLTGTVVRGDSSFIILELTDGSMRLLRPGERVEGYTLRTVSPGSAIIVDSSGRRLVLRTATSETSVTP